MNPHDNFIMSMQPTARRFEAKYGFAAEGLVAINISETNYGAAGSFFGIKGTGNAGSIDYTTWENYGPGHEHDVINDQFAAYASLDDAYQAFFDFIQIGRYISAWNTFQQTGDWEELIHGINRAGYATDPGWADFIIRLSEDVKKSPAWGTGGDMPEPTLEEIALAFASYLHFVRNGFDLKDLSPRDKECIRFAGGSVPA